MNQAISGPGAWQVGLAVMGSVGAVIWAYKNNHTGKVWLFLGGGIVGGYIGYLIDSR
jgi:hypothetical protein